MNSKVNFLKNTRVKLRAVTRTAILFVCLAGCASQPQVVFHTFEFDAILDSPNARILDFKYGNSKQPVASPSRYAVAMDQAGQRMAMGGYILKPDFLYVKWRNKATGIVFEESAELKKRLPSDITKCIVRFVIRNDHLFIYLLTQEPKPADWPSSEFTGFEHKKVYQVYPSDSES
ncbi:hypothetical protein [Noviherbaspirillum galbum]|uniref:Uncharacterized protein n=1 Tax=Noviherbaspirillum galbum TaxID=2709383 RepID=A0A6B3SRM2_9BURK|nr:hypothetical protein [Noviherbaspirillum galbum]NEX60299.1 hypothetical protein [Noviherbaspirillum galbum]